MRALVGFVLAVAVAAQPVFAGLRNAVRYRHGCHIGWRGSALVGAWRGRWLLRFRLVGTDLFRIDLCVGLEFRLGASLRLLWSLGAEKDGFCITSCSDQVFTDQIPGHVGVGEVVLPEESIELGEYCRLAASESHVDQTGVGVGDLGRLVEGTEIVGDLVVVHLQPCDVLDYGFGWTLYVLWMVRLEALAERAELWTSC